MAALEHDPVLSQHLIMTGRRAPDQFSGRKVSAGNVDSVGSRPTLNDLEIDETPAIVAALGLVSIVGLIALKAVGFRFVFGVTAGK